MHNSTSEIPKVRRFKGISRSYPLTSAQVASLFVHSRDQVIHTYHKVILIAKCRFPRSSSSATVLPQGFRDLKSSRIVPPWQNDGDSSDRSRIVLTPFQKLIESRLSAEISIKQLGSSDYNRLSHLTISSSSLLVPKASFQQRSHENGRTYRTPPQV